MKGAKYAAAVALLLASATAFAQGNPKFEFAKAEEVKAVEWKAQAKGGLIVTAGNSQTTSGTFNVNAARKEGNNRLALEGGVAYGRSNILTAHVNDNGTPADTTDDNIDALSRTTGRDPARQHCTRGEAAAAGRGSDQTVAG